MAIFNSYVSLPEGTMIYMGLQKKHGTGGLTDLDLLWWVPFRMAEKHTQRDGIWWDHLPRSTWPT